MAFPTPKTYTTVSGGRIDAGREAPDGYPLWRQGQAVNEIRSLGVASDLPEAITNEIRGWGAFAARRDTNELATGLNGGHTDGANNAFYTMDLNADSPSWTLRRAASSPTRQNMSHYEDGRPSSRHNYAYFHWVPQVGRYMTTTCRYPPGTAVDYTNIDAFDPTPGVYDWEPALTYPNGAGMGYGSAVDWKTGRIFYNSMRCFNPVSKTFGTAGSNAGVQVRYPTAFDSLRDRFFNLQWGGGEANALSSIMEAMSAPSTMSAVNASAITFNASSAYTQFLADKTCTVGQTPGTTAVGYCAMIYDDANDCFYWYSGQATSGTQRIYKIVPNNGTVWDMEVFATTGTTMVAPPNSGINGRMHYFPLLKGFSICPSGDGVTYFVRTS